MTDSNVVRLMAGQTARSVGLVDHTVVSRGRAAIAERLERLERPGHRYALVDAITDDDLTEIAGNRDKLEGKLQERYGKQKDEIRAEIDDWSKRLH
jgi:uncharacterized protein YgbK (DUF1537 family)